MKSSVLLCSVCVMILKINKLHILLSCNEWSPEIFVLLGSLVWTLPSHRASFSGRFYLILHRCVLVRKSHVWLVAPRKTLRVLPNEGWERIPGKCNVFESMEEEDSQNDRTETANRSHYAINRHI